MLLQFNEQNINYAANDSRLTSSRLSRPTLFQTAIVIAFIVSPVR